MKEPDEKPVVELIGADGNALSILGKCSQALKKAGADNEYVDAFMKEAMSGDYHKVLRTAEKYVDVI